VKLHIALSKTKIVITVSDGDSVIVIEVPIVH
jgi:hypothetical protein